MRAKRGRLETDDPLVDPMGNWGSWELGSWFAGCRVQGAGCGAGMQQATREGKGEGETCSSTAQ